MILAVYLNPFQKIGSAYSNGFKISENMKARDLLVFGPEDDGPVAARAFPLIMGCFSGLVFAANRGKELQPAFGWNWPVITHSYTVTRRSWIGVSKSRSKSLSIPSLSI